MAAYVPDHHWHSVWPTIDQAGLAALRPGKEVVERENANSPLRLVFNVIWIVLFGWEIVVAHLVFALILAVTIIGIPFAKQHIKLVPLALLPFGRDLR